MKNTTLRWLILSLLFVLPVVFVFGCRGDNEIQPAETDNIRLGYLRIGSDLPYFVASQEGLFEKHGLSVRAQRLGDSNQAMEALLQGQIDATDIIGSSVVLAAGLDAPEKFSIYMMSAAGPKNRIHKLIAHPASGITQVADLPGKRLAVFPGSQMRAYVELFLGTYLDEDALASVELVPLSPPQQIDAMVRNQVDAALTLEPTGSQLLSEGTGSLVLDNVLYESISKPRPFVTAFGIVNNTWAQESPGALAKLLLAYEEASELIKNDPARARANMQQALDLDPGVTERVQLYDYPVAPNLDINDIKFTSDLMVNEGILRSSPPIERLILRNFEFSEDP